MNVTVYASVAVFLAAAGLLALRYGLLRWGFFGDTWLEGQLRVIHRVQVTKLFAHALFLTPLVVAFVAAGAYAGSEAGWIGREGVPPRVPTAAEIQTALGTTGAKDVLFAAGLCGLVAWVWTLLLTGPLNAYPWFGLMRRAHLPIFLKNENEGGPVAALAYCTNDELLKNITLVGSDKNLLKNEANQISLVRLWIDHFLPATNAPLWEAVSSLERERLKVFRSELALIMQRSENDKAPLFDRDRLRRIFASSRLFRLASFIAFVLCVAGTVLLLRLSTP